jgi:hypothetical protein
VFFRWSHTHNGGAGPVRLESNGTLLHSLRGRVGHCRPCELWQLTWCMCLCALPCVLCAVFIYWCPENAPIKSKMLYSTVKVPLPLPCVCVCVAIVTARFSMSHTRACSRWWPEPLRTLA